MVNSPQQLSAAGSKRKPKNPIRMKASHPAAWQPELRAAAAPLSGCRDTDGAAAPWDVLVVPSLNLDAQQIALVQHHYEERQLFELIRLRQPKARMVFVTSKLLPELVVDAVLELLPACRSPARQRLKLFDTDGQPQALAAKLLSGRGCCNASVRC